VSFHHLDQYATVPSPITRLPPVARVGGAVFLAVVAATLPLGAWPSLALLGAVVVILSGLARLPLHRLAVRMSGPLLFVLLASVGLLVLVPGAPVFQVGWIQVTDAGVLRFASALGRGTVALGAAVVLVSTTTFPELLRALGQLRVPRTVTTALGLAYRLLYIAVDEVERLQRAARSRNAGAGTTRRRELLVGVTAAALGRSLARAERTHHAMLSRGYRGELASLDVSTWDTRAVVWAGALAAIVAAAAVWGRLG
jgi:cobalt/nickel transport system permease protein